MQIFPKAVCYRFCRIQVITISFFSNGCWQITPWTWSKHYNKNGWYALFVRFIGKFINATVQCWHSNNISTNAIEKKLSHFVPTWFIFILFNFLSFKSDLNCQLSIQLSQATKQHSIYRGNISVAPDLPLACCPSCFLTYTCAATATATVVYSSVQCPTDAGWWVNDFMVSPALLGEW